MTSASLMFRLTVSMSISKLGPPSSITVGPASRLRARRHHAQEAVPADPHLVVAA